MNDWNLEEVKALVEWVRKTNVQSLQLGDFKIQLRPYEYEGPAVEPARPPTAEDLKEIFYHSS